MKVTPFTLLAVCAFSFAIVLPFLPNHERPQGAFALRMQFMSNTGGYAQLYYDSGKGYDEAHSVRVGVQSTHELQTLTFPLPAVSIHHLRFDPIDRHARISFRDVRITDAHGRPIHVFRPEDFTPHKDIARLLVAGDRVELETAGRGIDPILAVALTDPIVLGRAPTLGHWLWTRALVVFGCVSLGLLALGRAPRRLRDAAAGLVHRTRQYALSHPRRTLACVALATMMLACYPVVFLGRSYVAPNFTDGTYLLYEELPTLPGETSRETENAKGSDVGALFWAHIPYSFVQAEALIDHGELPYWNRYNSCGSVLLGQGQSMFGDPLHLLVLATRGAAWAWDLKFLLAKWLFCFGLGLIILRTTRHLPAAALGTLASGFLGFFLYRLNHPAVFSFCYAPWILYAWICLAEARRAITLARSAAVLLLACVAEIHSGTVKEAYMLLLGMNAAGGIAALSVLRPWRQRLLVVGVGAWTGVIFVLLTAPSWLTFMDALHRSSTSYDVATAFQIQPSVTLGLFDEIFYRPIQRGHLVFNPSANFLVLTGVLYFLAAFRHAAATRMARGLAGSAVGVAALVFGVIPPQWIVKIPFLANVAHIDNSFSCVLIILLVVLAGFGWKAAFERLGTADGRGDLIRLGWGYALLLAPWIAFMQVVHRPIYGDHLVVTLLHWGHRVAINPFVWVSLASLTIAAAVLLLTTRRMLRLRRADAAGLLLAVLALGTLLWRHGLHTPIVGPADYVFTPGPRPDFRAASSAVEALQADQSEPSRVVGLGNNLFPGWTAAYRIEGITGPDALVNPFYRELADGLGLDRIWDWRVFASLDNLERQQSALDFLNVRYYVDLHGDQTVLGRVLTPVKSGDLDVYRSETAWPRAFFVRQAVAYEHPAELGAMARGTAAAPFAALQRIDLDRHPGLARFLGATPVEPGVAARDYALTTNSTAFTVDATGPGLAVLHEAWILRDFQARLDGQPVPVFRVNHAFKAVAIPAAGTHRVEFVYRPRRFSLALALAGTGGALALLSGLVAWRLDRRTVSPARPLRGAAQPAAPGEPSRSLARLSSASVTRGLRSRLRPHAIISPMRRPRLRRPLGLACCVAFLVGWVQQNSGQYDPRFEARLESSAAGEAKIYYDRGHGLSEADSAAAPVIVGTNHVRLPLPSEPLALLRFDPLDGPGTLRISQLQIVTASGQVVRRFNPTEFTPNDQIAEFTVRGDAADVRAVGSVNDPTLTVTLAPPLSLKTPRWQVSRFDAGSLVVWFLATALFAAAAESVWRQRKAWLTPLWFAAHRQPRRTLAVGAALAAILASYPVVFLGKSFVSPNSGTVLLYDRIPTVPGLDDAAREDVRGADVGAMMWAHLPYTAVQSRAIREEGTIALWNRFNSCGVTLLGQGQSMLADPLHFLVALTGAQTWAFDVKYVLCKALFAAGLGGCVWLLTRDLAAAVIVTFAGAFVGFFNFRVNHPGIFSVSYSPWILVGWFLLLRANDGRQLRQAAAVWFGANWLLLNSGTAKEAVALMISLNGTGFLCLLLSARPLRTKAWLAGGVAAAGVCFVLMTAPLWWTFLDALRTGQTGYAAPLALQTPRAWLIGLFDDIFYLDLHPGRPVYAPSANFLILLGCLCALFRPAALLRARAPVALTIGLFLAIALAFAWVPSRWIVALPFLANVHQLAIHFSGVAVVHAAVLAGWGFAAVRPTLGAHAPRYAAAILGSIGGLMIVFFANTTVWTNGAGLAGWRAGLAQHAVVYALAVMLPLALVTLVFVAAGYLRTHRLPGTRLVLAGFCVVVLLGRHGLHPAIPKTEAFLRAPGTRADVSRTSPASDFIQRQQATEAGRVLGTGHVLMTGFMSVHGFEGINGPDAIFNPALRDLHDAAGTIAPGGWHAWITVAEVAARRPLLDFLNVRQVATNPGSPIESEYYHLAASLDLDIYEAQTAWPRAFYTRQLLAYSDPADLLRQVESHPAGRPFAAVQSGDPGAPRSAVLGEPLSAAATDYELATNQTSFTIVAPEPGFAVLHETWLPGDFRVTVNDAPASYFRVNHAFKGVVLPAAGVYRVAFTYWPRHFTVSLILAAVGTLAAVALWLGCARLSALPRAAAGASDSSLA